MNSTPSTQPRHLTAIDLALNLGVGCGLGYLVYGWVGAGIGLAIVAARFSYLVARSAPISPADSERTDPSKS